MKNLLIRIRAGAHSLAFRFQQWRENRLHARNSKIKQHWQAGSMFGAVTPLGWMTRAEAIEKVQAMQSGPIAYIDDERGFIAFGNPPASISESK